MLNEIIEEKKREVAALTLPAHQSFPRKGLKQALLSSPFDLGLIAEVKRASPSKGIIVDEFDPEQIAREYESAGAAAISVLTDKPFFKGDKSYIKVVKQATGLPVLRKDFIIDEKQIEETVRLGADALLLIAGLMSNEKLFDLYKKAYDAGLECLVEVHNEAEIKSLLDVFEPEIIGINNRDLKTFKTDLAQTEAIIPFLPAAAVAVSESGIETREDIIRLQKAGAKGVLIGESLMRSNDKTERIRTLLANEPDVRG